MNVTNPRSIAVFGAGTMGAGIAQVVAQAGISVRLCDVEEGFLQSGLARIQSSLDKLLSKGAIAKEGQSTILQSIQTTTDRRTAVEGVELVVEAIPEQLELKKTLFAELEDFCPPSVIFATNTSSISISELAQATRRPDRFIGMHFFNPVPVMKLVEVVRGHDTSDATVGVVRELALKLGKVPVEVNDYPGFVSNRILMPMINEAVYCLMEGVATKEAIDQVMKLGMNHPMGPLELADFIGLDVCLDILEVLHRGLGDPKYRPCPLLRRMVASGRLGRKTGRGFYEYPKG